MSRQEYVMKAPPQTEQEIRNAVRAAIPRLQTDGLNVGIDNLRRYGVKGSSRRLHAILREYRALGQLADDPIEVPPREVKSQWTRPPKPEPEPPKPKRKRPPATGFTARMKTEHFAAWRRIQRPARTNRGDQ